MTESQSATPVINQKWRATDNYFSDLLLPSDPVLQAALNRSAAAGLPPISVTPTQGMFLHILALSIGARRILEIGTLGAYSTIWLGRALPAGGRLVTLESERKHAEVARENIAHADLQDRVDLRVGRAGETLSRMVAEKEQPFDLVFIDADKTSYSAYLDCSLELSHPGTVILADNVVRGGAVVEPDHSDPRVAAVRLFCERLASDARLIATVVQTVGEKGYDGFAIARVRDDG